MGAGRELAGEEMTGNKIQIIKALEDAPLEKLWELKEHREKRSLNQNSYYWRLCDG